MKRRKIWLVSLLVVLTVTLMGCGSSTSNKSQKENTTKSSEKETGKTETKADVDLSSVTIRFGEVGWASDQALLKAAGLDDTPYKIEYSTFQGGNLALEAMAADQIDFTGSSEIPPLFFAAASNAGNFKIVAIKNSNTTLQEVVVPKGSAIKSIADLKGKKVGYIKSTTAHYFLYEMLKSAGLNWSDIKPVEITTADGVTALVGGQIDAFASYGNSINAAKNNGATTLADAKDILSGNFPFEVSNSALKDDKKKAAIADLLARLQLAFDWSNKNVDKWAQVSADPSGLSVDDNLNILKKGFAQRSTTIQPVSDSAIASEQKVEDAFSAVGMLTTKVDIKSLYDNSLAQPYQNALTKLKAKK